MRTARAASPAGRLWARFGRNPTGVGCGLILLAFLLLGLAAPVVALIAGLDPAQTHPELLDADGLPVGAFGGASREHWLGVEPATGSDLFIRLVYGLRTSLAIASTAAFLATALAIVVGATAAYLGGWADAALRWSVDIALSFPLVLLCLALTPLVEAAGSAGSGSAEQSPSALARIVTLIGVLTFYGWTYTARLIRAEVRTLRQQDFVAAARAAGAGPGFVVRRELLPNLWTPILVMLSVLVPRVILGEATLSFLGVGVAEPVPAWGRTIRTSLDYLQVDPFYSLVSGAGLVLLVFVLSLLADALQDALDPRGTA